MSKKILIITITAIIMIGLFFAVRYFIQDKKEEAIDYDFVQCLVEAGMVIYGSQYCSACAALVESFGGYDIIGPIYVECSEEQDKCMEEMKTDYVPEIQIKGEIYTGLRDLNSIGGAVGCEI